MAKIDKEYHKLLQTILKDGFTYEDPNRKNVNRIQIPSYQFIHNFEDGFPAITTKKLFWKGVVAELLWFLKGDTNIKYLVDNGINIWNKDAYNLYLKEHLPENGTLTFEEFIYLIKQNEKPIYHELGNLGRIYGAQWRGFTGYEAFRDQLDDSMDMGDYGVDQISNLIKNLKEKPLSTQHIVTAWNPAELDDMALPPCHWSFEILVKPLSMQEEANLNNVLADFLKNNISGEEWERNANASGIPRYKFILKWHQRSVDTFLGLPFNIASYALLAHIIGKLTNMIPKAIIGDLSNVHIYENHLDAVKEQLTRDTTKYNNSKFTLSHSAELLGKKYDNINIDWFLDKHDIEDFVLDDYESYPGIKAEMLSYNKY